MERLQTEQIKKDLNHKMVFISGPRQVGKTWLAKTIMSGYNNPLYLNYDAYGERKIIEEQGWLAKNDLIVFDEIHKMPEWKNFLKGVYDTKPSHQKILVTGSSRLETFRQSGDSLAGRYILHRLLPFTLNEVGDKSPAFTLERLLERGGFPEPFLYDDNKDAKRWRMQYFDGLIRTDILTFENIRDLKSMNLLLELLRNRTASPVSLSSLGEDLQISVGTVRKYLEILESLFIIFRITPYSNNIARSILKEPKIYFYDTALVEGGIGVKIENAAALALLKHCYYKTDNEGDDYRLHYIRNKDGEEVDFCVVKNNEPLFMAELKNKRDAVPKALKKFNQLYGIPAKLLINELDQEYQESEIEILNLSKMLYTLF